MSIIAARFPGSCALCDGRWTQGAPIAPFPDSSSYAGRWGHPACVTLDDMGLPSIDAAKDRIAEIRTLLAKGGEKGEHSG